MKKKEVSVLVKPSAAADVNTTKAIDDLRKEVQGRSFTDGSRILEAVELESGTNKIVHGLGRRPKGYLVVGQRAVTMDTVRRLVSPPAWQPADNGNWTEPDGTTDYYACTAGPTHIAVALPVQGGETVTAVGVNFYRGQATNPTTQVLLVQNAASASAATPTVAWTTPTSIGAGTGAWGVVHAEYDFDVLSGDCSTVVLDVTARALDRLRTAYIEVTPAAAVPVLTDENDDHTDTDKFLYLVAAGYSATVDLLVF